MISFLVSFILTLAITPVVILLARRLGWVAKPREDRFSTRPTAERMDPTAPSAEGRSPARRRNPSNEPHRSASENPLSGWGGTDAAADNGTQKRAALRSGTPHRSMRNPTELHI